MWNHASSSQWNMEDTSGRGFLLRKVNRFSMSQNQSKRHGTSIHEWSMYFPSCSTVFGSVNSIPNFQNTSYTCPIKWCHPHVGRRPTFGCCATHLQSDGLQTVLPRCDRCASEWIGWCPRVCLELGANSPVMFVALQPLLTRIPSRYRISDYLSGFYQYI